MSLSSWLTPSYYFFLYFTLLVSPITMSCPSSTSSPSAIFIVFYLIYFLPSSSTLPFPSFPLEFSFFSVIPCLYLSFFHHLFYFSVPPSIISSTPKSPNMLKSSFSILPSLFFSFFLGVINTGGHTPAISSPLPAFFTNSWDPST